MKAAIYATIFLSLTLMTPAPSFSYTYLQFPPDPSYASSQNSELSEDEAGGQQQQTVDKYLAGLLNNLGTYNIVPKSVEEQLEQVQESYEEAGETFQDVFNKLLDAIYGPPKESESDDEQPYGMVTTTASPQQESEDEDDGPLTTTVSFVVTTTEADEEDSDDMDVTTAAPLPTTTEADDDDNEDDESTTTVAPMTTTDDDANDDDSDDDDVTTPVAPATTTSTDDDVSEDDDDDITTTVAPATTTEDDNSDDSDDSDDSDEDDATATTAAPTSAPTTVVIDRTLSTVDDVDDSDDDDEMTTTMMPATTTEDDDDSDDDDEMTTTAAPTTTTDDDDDDDVVTTAAPVPTTSVPNMCDDCDFKHGIGYNPHSSDCTLFVQCRMNDKGVPVVAGVQSCPHGLYWNQQKLVCDYPKNVQCVDDICRSSTKKMKRSASTCRGFWDCSNGKAVAKCCAAGFAFNPVTSYCQYDPTCLDDCMPTHTPVDFECKGMRSVPGDRSVYEVKTGSTWTRMSCPPTLAFSENPCGCSAPLNKPPPAPQCVPALYMPFTHDARDYSGRHAWVKNEGVLVKDGKAFFDGNSRLIVNRFAHAWWGATVYIHLRYRTLSSAPGLRYSLVSNGDCKARPSLAVCAGSNGVEFYAETQGSAMPANFTVPYGYTEGAGWQDILYRLDEGHLAGYVNTRTGQVPAQGVLETRKHGLVIGSGGGCEDFEGFIDELTIYLCRPHNK